jgi:hypothetical protein
MHKTDDQAQVADAGSARAGEVGSPPSSFTPADTAGSPPLNPAASIPADFVLPAGAFCQPRDHVRRLVQRVLLHIYGPNGPDLGESEGLCHRKVDEWLRKHDQRTVSRATLRRAKAKLKELKKQKRKQKEILKTENRSH